MESKYVSRQEQKEVIRRATRENEKRVETPEYREEAARRALDSWRRRLVILAIVLLIALFFFFMYRNYEFTTYEITEESGLPVSQNTEIYGYSDGMLFVSMDSVTFVRNEQVVYTEQIFCNAPVVTIAGEYFAIHDRSAYQVQIYDREGILSTVKLSRKIRAVSMAKNGVIAVFTESNEAAYVSYFDRYGTRISVELRTYLDVSGYPMDIAVSPDAQKLLIPYFSTQNGIGESRLVLYDFEYGDPADNFEVASISHFYDDDLMLFRCEFIDDTHMVAVGDHGLVFLSENLTGGYDEKTVLLKEEIRSVLHAGDYTGLITKAETLNGEKFNKCTLYDSDGKCYSSFRVPTDYELVSAGEKNVIFTEGKEISLYNLSGQKRYGGTILVRPLSVFTENERTLYFSSGGSVSKIVFQ